MDNINIDDLKSFSSISDIKTSPSRKYIAYFLLRVNEFDKYDKKIYILNLDNKESRELVIDFDVKSIFWKSDDKLFIVSTEGKVSVYNTEKNLINNVEIDSNYTPYFLEELKENLYLCGDSDFVDKTVNAACKIIDELPFVENGLGFVGKKRKHIFMYDAKLNQKVDINDKYFHIGGFSVDESKNNIIYWGQDYKNIRLYENELFSYNIASGISNKISFDEKMFIEYANYITEKEIIILASNMKDYGENQEPTFYIYNTYNKSMRIIAEPNMNLWNSMATDCKMGSSKVFVIYKNELYFVSSMNYSVNLYKINCDGKIDQISDAVGTIDGYAIGKNNIYVCGLREQNLQEIYKLSDKNEIQISNHNEIINSKMKSIPEKVGFITEDGREIDGWIMKPIDFDDGKKYSTMLNIHGGPKMMYGDVYNHELQLQCEQGYVVVFCNPIGSNGKGNEFSDIRGRFGKDDFDDIMGFLHFVCEQYDFIDNDKLGVMGGSYGGYMTNWIIGHTDVFKVAVSQRSISNWITMYGLSDIGYHWTKYQTNATPWDDFHALWEQSPLKYANKVKTPTLFIHSNEDYRCPISEGVQMFTALKMHDIDSKLIMFDGENHLLAKSGKVSNRIIRLNEIMKWLKSYI